jgi:hypothetical protein
MARIQKALKSAGENMSVRFACQEKVLKADVKLGGVSETMPVLFCIGS